EKLNAINDLMLDEIEAALNEAETDDDMRYVIMKGAGRCFSVGQDLSGEGTDEVMPPDPRLRSPLTPLFKTDARLMRRWQRISGFSKHMVAQVHGYCLAMGCDLMMLCRTAIAGDDAVFGDPSVRMGYASANPFWTWRVGPKKAKELLLTGRYINAKEAFRIGLVNLVVARDELEEGVDEVVETLDLNAGGIGGADAEAGFLNFGHAAQNIAGLGSAWGFSAGLHALSAVQRRGFAPGEFNFWETKDKLGMKGAIEERDAPFERLFPKPEGGPK
ncbi:MAG: enoyl-CoA hydratase/isomerase family protein, partial [Thermodesulfobacteriota bacterium]|nr:enoyl-CoA hydratase/isomerase family protein [Thermodesulfobacteriota bacterium]